MKRILQIFMSAYLAVNLIGFPLQASALELLSEEEMMMYHDDKAIETLIKKLPKSADLQDPHLILVNGSNRLGADIPMDFAMTGSGHYYRLDIQDAFQAWMEAAESDGYWFQTISAYRSIDQQAYNYQARVESYLADGYSYEEADYWTSLYVAPANASEHSTGLAFDLLGTDWTSSGGELHANYQYMDSAVWLEKNSADYGFILRYPEGKTEITGYNYEPWHYRYVGVEHAQFMHDHQLTLEEYLTLIEMRDVDSQTE